MFGFAISSLISWCILNKEVKFNFWFSKFLSVDISFFELSSLFTNSILIFFLFFSLLLLCVVFLSLSLSFFNASSFCFLKLLGRTDRTVEYRFTLICLVADVDWFFLGLLFLKNKLAFGVLFIFLLLNMGPLLLNRSGFAFLLLFLLFSRKTPNKFLAIVFLFSFTFSFKIFFKRFLCSFVIICFREDNFELLFSILLLSCKNFTVWALERIPFLL